MPDTATPEPVRIAVWSGPRNISTAMMRAWENRRDCAVWDEPFYGCYLAETGLAHPMRAEVLAAEPTDWAAVATRCAARDDAPIVYQKHMCQHMVAAAPLDWIGACRHAFLIRAPERVAVSFARGWPDMTAADLGFARQAELFDQVAAQTGKPPPVLEAEDVLTDPQGMLRALCAALEVPWDEAMLSWPPGPRASDGVWAAHWYGSVHRSTGFARAPGPLPEIGTDLAAIVEACRPAYATLRRHRLNPLAPS
ncbi:MAG: HAD family hydrolase [Pseudomonadota bacterium]